MYLAQLFFFPSKESVLALGLVQFRCDGRVMREWTRLNPATMSQYTIRDSSTLVTRAQGASHSLTRAKKKIKIAIYSRCLRVCGYVARGLQGGTVLSRAARRVTAVNCGVNGIDHVVRGTWYRPPLFPPHASAVVDASFVQGSQPFTCAHSHPLHSRGSSTRKIVTKKSEAFLQLNVLRHKKT